MEYVWLRGAALLAAVALAGAAAAQGLPPGALSAGAGPSAAPPPAALPQTTTAVAIRVDGQLSDAAWGRAEAITSFVQRDPTEGAPPTHRTEARVAYDDEAIYIAVHAFDPEPDKIKAFLTRRDADSSSDWIRVYIDSYHDKRTAYSFAVNPVGVKLDTYHYNDTNEDDSWDAVWDVVAARDPEGWHAEFRIPYSQLRFSSGGDGRLGFAIARNVARLDETTTWPLLSKNASGWVSSFGELTGVVRAGPTKRLEIVPYTVAELTTEPRQAGNPLQKNPDPGATFGADLKYAVTPALTLTATVNPDFGQVEADPAVVNLGAFETFFQERRPFFIEGSGNFASDCRDCNLFYSRRIGRQPRGFPRLQDGEYMARPHHSTILGAGKLTGRVGEFSLGILGAATQEESATIASGEARRREVIEPQTFYSVSRLKREFSDQSSLGFILTTTNRSLTDTLQFLPSSAITGGGDMNWRIGTRWALDVNWAGSRVQGSTEAISLLQRSNVHSFQRPDADHVEFDPLATVMNGHSGSVAFNKIAGERTRLNVNVGYLSPGFDTNDLGFLQRADSIPQAAWFGLRWNTPGKYVRSKNLNFNQWSNFNVAGDRMNLGGNVNSHWTFQNQWSTGGGFNYNTGGVDDRLTRGGPAGLGTGNINSWQYLNTNNNKAVSFYWNSNFGNNFEGSRWFGVEPGINLRPTTALSAEIGFGYGNDISDAQWVGVVAGADSPHYVFARLHQITTSITTRVNYTLTPNLSVQVYARPFVSAGAYNSYKELVSPMADRYADRYAPYAYAGNADFNVLSFRTTNVMRWEYKPGSALFVVWQQGREGFTQRGNYSFSRDFNDVFGTPSTNTLLVKLAYWFNP
jgi:hypothetical protein